MLDVALWVDAGMLCRERAFAVHLITGLRSEGQHVTLIAPRGPLPGGPADAGFAACLNVPLEPLGETGVVAADAAVAGRGGTQRASAGRAGPVGLDGFLAGMRDPAALGAGAAEGGISRRWCVALGWCGRGSRRW